MSIVKRCCKKGQNLSPIGLDLYPAEYYQKSDTCHLVQEETMSIDLQQAIRNSIQTEKSAMDFYLAGAAYLKDQGQDACLNFWLLKSVSMPDTITGSIRAPISLRGGVS